jgi:hypothetical protein
VATAIDEVQWFCLGPRGQRPQSSTLSRLTSVSLGFLANIQFHTSIQPFRRPLLSPRARRSFDKTPGVIGSIVGFQPSTLLPAFAIPLPSLQLPGSKASLLITFASVTPISTSACPPYKHMKSFSTSPMTHSTALQSNSYETTAGIQAQSCSYTQERP